MAKQFSAIEFVPSELDLMEAWIRERESVRKKKEAGLPKPWSDNPLFTRYRWCNVRRWSDRVSVALSEKWYGAADYKTQLVAATLGRLVNWPDSLLEITDGKPFEMPALDRAVEVLKARASRGVKVWTGAYVIPGVPGRNKVESILDLVNDVAAHAGDVLRPSMRETWKHLTEFDGLGSFLAGQIVADLAHLSVGSEWIDRDVWAPVGPGSSRGLNRLAGRPKDKVVSQEQFEVELPQLIAVLRPRIEDIWSELRLQAFDAQNCLCENDKSRRLQLGEGRVRALYDGAGDTQPRLF